MNSPERIYQRGLTPAATLNWSAAIIRNGALSLAVAAVLTGTAFANTYNVTGQADGAGTVTLVSGTIYNASTLRAAVNAANTVAGPHVINVPPGTYNLTLGELALGTAGNLTVTLNGTGPAANIIVQHDLTTATARVLNLDPNLLGGVNVTIQNLTIAHGRNDDGLGGAGIICGYQGAPADSTAINNCVLLDNRVIGTNAAAVGGVIQNIGGTLTVQKSIFGGNSAGNFSGGAIFYDSHSPSVGTFQVSACLFTNNVAADPANGGGAIFVSGVAGSTLDITNSAFIANQVTSATGNGGAIVKVGGAILTVTGCTFLSNQVLGTSGLVNTASGGAIDNAGGPMTIVYSRFVGNTAAVAGKGYAMNNAALAGATLTADNNWWGLNNGPGANDLAGASVAAWLKLNHYANPSVVPLGGTTTLTATILTNSAGAYIPVANLGVLLGLPIVFDNPVNGSISAAQTAIQPGGTATATFTVGPVFGPTSADATVDSATATAVITISCPSITGILSGNVAICPGGFAAASAVLNGGTPPYTVTLDNGGGTVTSSNPVSFALSPLSNTTYSVVAATDVNGCAATVSGTALITINPVPATPVIMVNPSVVSPNSTTNQATASAAAAYAWTIGNGIITSPANQQTITYTAGPFGPVTLGVTVFNASGCAATASVAVPALPLPVTSLGCSLRTNYFSSLTFTDAVIDTSCGIAWDGTNYWAVSGGSSSGARLGRYDSNGVLVTTYSPGLDFRSIFTNSDGALLARAYNDRVIYRQGTPGVFTNSGVSLTGGSLYSQAAVVLNGNGTEFLAMYSGVVSRWSASGAYLGSVSLQGFGTLTGENTSPQNRALAVAGEFWLTVAGNQLVSVWDNAGNRLFVTTLSQSGTVLSSYYSFSYANSKVFISDGSGGLWRGYDLCNPGGVAIYAAEATASWNADAQAKVLGGAPFTRASVFDVSGVNPVPALSDLRKNPAVLVYSDYGFSNATNMGNALADYLDLGGGVAMAAFAFDTTGSYGIQGRVKTAGYLPFTTGGSSGMGSNVLVMDLPSHPLVQGVASFYGGASGYQNNPIAIAGGATLVAHWSNGQPLVGARELAQGRMVGLNFFPPSSDARSDFWAASTDGGILLANALMWAGKAPPIILAGPASVVAGAGSPVAFNITAAGNPPLTYQWRSNGTNIAGATASTLSLVAQPGNSGTYSVIVSNAYGAALSRTVTLRPPLRFLPAVPVGNALPLYLGTADGSDVTPDRLARLTVYASPNPALPLSTWTPIPNPIVLTNGLLRIDGLSVTNPASLFFRAGEAL